MNFLVSNSFIIVLVNGDFLLRVCVRDYQSGETIVTRNSINIIIFKMKVEAHKVLLENAKVFFTLYMGED